jgi:hypothetical protein
MWPFLDVLQLRGRSCGLVNFATVLARTLEEKVVINENGVRKAGPLFAHLLGSDRTSQPGNECCCLSG